MNNPTLRELLKQKEQQSDTINFVSKDYIFHTNFNSPINGEAVEVGGRRHYTTPSGNSYPSVTTVLGNTKSKRDKKVLDDWIDRVGIEESERIKERAAQRGTIVHGLAEEYIKNGEIPNSDDKLAYRLFKKLYKELQKLDNIHLIEGFLYSDELRMAGRVDCVAEYNGVLSVIDFKTSTKIKQSEWITDYYLQATCYALMYSKLYNQKIKQIVIIITDETMNDEAQVFIMKPINYVADLVQRSKEYHSDK